MRVEESVIIHRPVEDVFGFLKVRSNDSAWMASVLESQWLDSTQQTQTYRSNSADAAE